jgi:hypothetical protein
MRFWQSCMCTLGLLRPNNELWMSCGLVVKEGRHAVHVLHRAACEKWVRVDGSEGCNGLGADWPVKASMGRACHLRKDPGNNGPCAKRDCRPRVWDPALPRPLVGTLQRLSFTSLLLLLRLWDRQARHTTLLLHGCLTLRISF